MIFWFNRVAPAGIAGTILTMAASLPSPPPALAEPGGTPPRVSSITPSSGPVGTHVTLMGSGFSSPRLKVKVDNKLVDYLPNQSGDESKVSFDIPRSFMQSLDPKTIDQIRNHHLHVHRAMTLLTTGTHELALETSDGTSNAVSFTVSPFPAKVTLDASSLLQASGYPIFSGTAENLDAVVLQLATLYGRPGTFRGGFNGYTVPKPIPVHHGRWSVDLRQAAYDVPQLCPLEPGNYRVQIWDPKTLVHFDLPQSRVTVLPPK